MIHSYVVHNGKMLKIEQVRLSPGQAGLLNGWGLFSTLRVIEGVPFAFERHWKRLQKDAHRTHCPFPFAENTVLAQLHELIRMNEVKSGSARIYVIYNKAGSWRSDENFPEVDLILYTGPLPAHREPARLGIREHGRHAASPLAGVKVTSWLNNVWNLYEAQQDGFDEVVLLNERGEVSECTAANVFCVKNAAVVTPPLDSGCLEGITRSVLLEIGPKAGVEVIEKALRPEELFSSDEVFISSTNRTLVGVSDIAGHSFAAAPGAVTLKLEHIFADYISDYVARHAVSRLSTV